VRQTRIHTSQSLSAGQTIVLEPEPSRHLLRVLRLRQGDPVVVFADEGREYAGVIAHGDGKRCRVELGQARDPRTESPLPLALVQSIARGDRMDWCIQKACELGASRIIPVFSERTGVRLDEQRAERRQHHWQAVAVAACEQSGRCRVPPVDRPVALDAAELGIGRGLVLDPDGDHAPQDIEPPPDGTGLTLAGGPEGGFSMAEIEFLAQRGFVRLRLGPRVLRSETAGPAALAVLQALHGDWRPPMVGSPAT